jgi:Hint domain
MGCAPLCKCASPDTPIATEAGQAPIASLRVGDRVYSVDRGVVRLVPIVRTQRIPAQNHRVVRLTLTTGSVLEISRLHPTADGRSFGELVKGGLLDGVEIRDTETIPYGHDATYDILPDSDTGTYFAGGVLLASTLANSARISRVEEVTAPACAAAR